MKSNTFSKSYFGRQRRGVAMLYIVASMAVLIGFCSLAVDLGRVQTAKTELRRAADAAARAAVANLSAGTTATLNAAYNMAANDKADGGSVKINKSTDVQFIAWVAPGKYTVQGSATAPGVNAVRVYCRRTKGTGNPVPLVFGQILGIATCDVTASSMALLNTTSTTQFVAATSNPWLAGEPTGTLGSQPDPNYPSSTHKYAYDIAGPAGGYAPDGQRYSSPVQVLLNVTPGSVINVTNVSGGSKNDPTERSYYDPTGTVNGAQSSYHNDQAGGVSEHGMSDAWMPINSLNGVFLTDKLPDSRTAPPPLDFSTSSARNYTDLSPKLQQVFYIGDGQTTGSQQQTIVVPPGATRMFLGTMDGHEWNNNVGGFTATITQTQISVVE